MKKIVVAVAILLAGGLVQAQDKTVQELKDQSSKTIAKDPNDTAKKVWKLGGLFNVVFGQTSLSNWAAGGDNLSLNVNGIVNLHAYYLKGRNSWDNNLDMSLGYVKTTSLGSRKSDDNIDLTTKYGYRLTDSSHWYVGLLGDFRTQFAPGFKYADTGTRRISEFLSPAYGIISLGINYEPNKNFSVFISPISSRWVIVTATGLNPLTPNDKGNVYGVPVGKTVENEIGAYLSATYMKEIIKNVTYKGKLDLFSNYKHDPQNVDVYMTNLLSTNIFKGLSFSIGLDLIYDDDTRIFGPNGTGARTQFREYIGLGYLAKF